ncbi:MAG: cupin domain-containing protein [Deltaproteobacteria bacterium]|nr:cupin domain-containing protein [Deltaproteobacteria bacterium]
MEPVNIENLKSFSKEGFRPNILHMGTRFKIPLICMEDGQFIPPHPGATGIFYVIEGTAEFTIAGETKEVKADSIVIAPQGTERGIKAKGRIVVIAFHIT